MASTSMPVTTTPVKTGTKALSYPELKRPPSLQNDLKTGIGDELGPHTWQYDAQTIARMLSPKVRKPSSPPIKSGDIDALEYYDVVADRQVFDRTVRSASHLLLQMSQTPWPSGSEEKAYYKPLAQFLNNSVSAAQSALDQHGHSFAPRNRRIYVDLNFIIYDRPTLDGIDGSAPLKPDLMGGRGLQEGGRVYWSPPDVALKAGDIPLEVKGRSKELIRQCGTHARSLFSADPLRQFALVLAFEQEQKELYFLIFHRGGLSASKALSVTSMDDRMGILRIFLSILSEDIQESETTAKRRNGGTAATSIAGAAPCHAGARNTTALDVLFEITA